MRKTTSCWCGGTRLEPFGEGYRECADCGTLVRGEMPADDVTRVRDEERDFYGRRYWLVHQAELGLGDLAARSVADLPERCLHWLAAALRYKTPPGRALELGCAHGAFTALLAWSGFAATGLELSPWVAGEARRRFGVPVLEGPLEDQQLEPASFDLVAAMDVLEHLPDPVGTVGRAAELLADDGVLLVQTPCRPAGRALDDLRRAGHRFPEMLLPEHLHLFSESSVRRLLARVGLAEVEFEPAFFAHYDMFLVASRRPLTRRSGEDVRAGLAGSPAERLVRALLDLGGEAEDARRRLEEMQAAYIQADGDRVERQKQVDRLAEEYRQADEDRTERQRQLDELQAAYEKVATENREGQEEIDKLQEAYRQADADRTERQKQVDELESAYRQADADRTERQKQVDELESAYRQADADRTERQKQVDELESAYRQADADRTERQKQVDELERAYRQADADRTKRQKQIDELERAYRQADADRTKRQKQIDELERAYRQADADRTERRRQIDELAEAYREADADSRELRRRIDGLRSRFAALDQRHTRLRALVADHRGSRVYRTLVRLGRWRDYDRHLLHALDAPAPATPPARLDAGELRETWTFESYGARRRERQGPVAVDLTALLSGGENGGAKLVATALVDAFSRLAPEREFVLLTSAACHRELAALEGSKVRRRRVETDPTGLASLLAGDPFAALFSPLTAPPWSDPRVPLVCLIHDLQYLALPELFDDADRAARHQAFRCAVDRADRIVTVSEYVRGTVLEHVDDEERVIAVHHGLAGRLPRLAEPAVAATLERFGLERGRFLLYPANFWPHKNHRMLLTAFGQLRARRPDDGVRLVLTGARRPDPAPVIDAVERMGLGDAVVALGWVSEAELAALYAGCLALVFPSLYEGFGMPVVEAMAMGRPVACSNVTALPEVAGDAALFFDPRKPAEIAAAIERLASDAELVETLRRRGRRRAREIGDAESMARAYLEVIEAAIASPRYRDRLAGLYGDGWTSRRIVVSSSGSERDLELDLANPRDEAVTVEGRAGDERRRVTLAPRQSLRLRCRLPAGPGYLELDVSPTFCPAERGGSTDVRHLGLQLSACRLGHGQKNLLQ